MNGREVDAILLNVKRIANVGWFVWDHSKMAHKNNPWKKSRSHMRWKWRKKRTRRLQRKRRKMRQRAK